jgi:hypothetical protein
VAFAPGFTAARPSPLLAGIPEAATARPAATLRDRVDGRPAAERAGIVLDFVLGQTAALLGHRDAAAVDPGRPFRELGLTSLTAVELRNLLSAGAGVALPTSLVYDHPTPAAVAELVGSLLGGGEPDGSAVDASLDRFEAALAELPSDSVRLTAIAARLRRLVSTVDGKGAAAGSDGLDAASADDLFQIIQNEFGKS